MSNGCNQFWWIWCSSRRGADACNIGWPAPARWSAAGQRVLTILDLNDVYMTIYLPADEAGQAHARRRGAHHSRSVPAICLSRNTISFVATEAQFTPKSVETAEEREKLMFRVKLQADPEVLDQYHRLVKTGVRGLGFVRTDPKVPWPDELAGEASAMT